MHSHAKLLPLRVHTYLITANIVQKYAYQIRASLAAKFTEDSPPTMSLGLDAWSQHHHGYLGINSHHINKEWEREIFNLACVPFDEHHTAENIYNRLDSVVKDWDSVVKDWEFEDKVGLCVRDNASNMKAAFELEISNLKSIGCLSHTLQLCINDEIFKQISVENLIKKCKALAGHANMSTIFYAEFYKQQRLIMNITERLSLKQDVDTR